MIRVKDKGERKMSNKNLIVNTPEPKPGILERGDLFAIAIGMVIGSGMVTLIGPAMAMTGYSVWLAYLTAIVMGFFMVFPYIILGGTMRVAGGPYSIVTNLSGVSAGGLVAYTKLVTPILNSSFALALGLYVNNLLPGITVKAIAVVGICILFVLNLLGMDIFAKVSKILSTILLITMVLYVVFGLTQIKQPIFQFSGDKMFTGGFKGFMLAALLLINSANGYYNILWYGKDAKKATKDVPFASMACVPCLLFIYVGLAMVTGGVLPHDEVAGAPTILPAAQAILPGAVYKIFMIGGPIMAIITTLNGVFNDVRYPLAQAAKDGWLPKFILKENRFGAPYLIYTYTLIVVLIPIVTDMSIVTITNIFQVITFFMNVTVVYAISRLPKRYPEAWAKNKFHFSNGALYTFCTVSIIIYTVIFVKAGGPYSIVTNLSGVSAGGLVAYTKLVTPILNSSFALALGLYVNNLLPGITVKAIAVVGICILFVLNLLGMDIFAKVSKILSTILLITMVLYVVFGLTQIKQPIFQFSGDKMFTGGFKGFMLAALLLINSANGYYNILWYGKDAKKATKDVPFASMACVPCLLFIYVGLAMVTGGVLPHDEVAGAPTILPAAQAILPGAVYKIFMIGGPIMAIITTLNGVFNDVRYPLAQAAKDGWLPKFILKENRFGAPYLIYTYTLIVVLIPIVTDMSIVTITNIFQVITFFMNVTVVYAISRLPKRYPEAWAKNKFHFSNGAFCTVSIIIYTVIFVKGIFSIKVSYAVAAVIVMLALILIGIYLTKKGGIRIETSLWDPSVKKEEK